MLEGPVHAEALHVVGDGRGRRVEDVRAIWLVDDAVERLGPRMATDGLVALGDVHAHAAIVQLARDDRPGPAGPHDQDRWRHPRHCRTAGMPRTEAWPRPCVP